MKLFKKRKEEEVPPEEAPVTEETVPEETATTETSEPEPAAVPEAAEAPAEEVKEEAAPAAETESPAEEVNEEAAAEAVPEEPAETVQAETPADDVTEEAVQETSAAEPEAPAAETGDRITPGEPVTIEEGVAEEAPAEGAVLVEEPQGEKKTKEPRPKREPKKNLPLLLVDRGMRTTGVPGAVKGLALLAAIVAVYIAIGANYVSFMHIDDSDDFKMVIYLVASGFCLLLLPIGIVSTSACRDGRRSLAIAAATGMLMVFTNFIMAPAAINVYYDYTTTGLTIATTEYILMGIATLATVFGCYYSVLREKKFGYTVCWLILIILAATQVYLNGYVFMDNYDAELDLEYRLTTDTYALFAIYYLVLVIALLAANPRAIIDRSDIPEGYCPVFLSSDHERKSILLKSASTMMIACSLLFIISGLLMYNDNDLTLAEDYIVWVYLLPFVVMLIASIVVRVSKPRNGPATHAAKYIPIMLIALGISNFLLYYAFDSQTFTIEDWILAYFPLNSVNSDVFVVLYDHFKFEDPQESLRLFAYSVSGLLIGSAVLMLALKRFIRLFSILALVGLTCVTLNLGGILSTAFPFGGDYIRIALSESLLLNDTSPKLFGLTLIFGYLTNLLAMLYLMGAVVTKCDYTQIRAESEPVISLDDLLHPKPVAAEVPQEPVQAAPQQVYYQPAPGYAPAQAPAPQQQYYQQPPQQQAYYQPTPAPAQGIPAFCSGCGKSIANLAPGVAFCPYCGRALPKQGAAQQQAYYQPAPGYAQAPQQQYYQQPPQQQMPPQAPADGEKDYEITENVKYLVHVVMPKKVRKGHFRYDHVEFRIGGQEYRGQLGKTRDLRLNGGTYKFTFKQVNFGENPKDNEASTTVNICGETTLEITVNREGLYEILVS